MKICVIYPKVCSKSANALAVALGGVAINPYEWEKRDFTEFDLVINYGTSCNIRANRIINKRLSVARCIDKIATFMTLRNNDIPTVDFVERKENIPKTWKSIVARSDSKGSRAKELDYFDKGQALPDVPLYTEYFEHKFEFRITVVMGKVVGRYLKNEVNGEWNLECMDPEGFGVIDHQCIRAAEMLGIDYVGFDVLSNNQTDFVILEANSGPILTDDATKAIREWVINNVK